jgi:protein NUD1
MLHAPDSPAPMRNTYTSSKYRLDAANLMAQLRNDMKSRKRVFLEDSESYFTANRDPSIGPISNAMVDPSPEHSRRSVFSASSRSRRSPRSSPRQSPLPPDEDLASQVSRITISERKSSTSSTAPRSAQLLAPPNPNQPSYPFSSIRSATNEDLNRFVSSSTASGTTLTSSSVPSYVKHAGPVQIRTIAPSDVPALPDRMGDMMFDKVMMRWVKSSAQVTGSGDYLPTEENSEDPFVDIESIKDDSRSRDDTQSESSEVLEGYPHGGDLSRVEEEHSEIEDEEEMELTTFETDMRVVEVMTGYEDGDGIGLTDSDEEEFGEPEASMDSYDDVEEEMVESSAYIESVESEQNDTIDARNAKVNISNAPEWNTAPLPTPNVHASSSNTSIIRSAMKTPGTSMTPTSVLKDPKYKTPLRRSKHRRSVSFSDGKRDGPIRGLVGVGDGDGHGHDVGDEIEGQQLASARSKRIADMMAALEDTGESICFFCICLF